MTKFVPDATIDTMLTYIAGSTRIDVLSASSTPANLDGTMGTKLGLTTADFTLAAGDASGRKIVIAQHTGISILVTGWANHVALSLSSDSTIRLITTCTSISLTLSGKLTIPSWDHEVTDPT